MPPIDTARVIDPARVVIFTGGAVSWPATVAAIAACAAAVIALIGLIINNRSNKKLFQQRQEYDSALATRQLRHGILAQLVQQLADFQGLVNVIHTTVIEGVDISNVHTPGGLAIWESTAMDIKRQTSLALQAWSRLTLSARTHSYVFHHVNEAAKKVDMHARGYLDVARQAADWMLKCAKVATKPEHSAECAWQSAEAEVRQYVSLTDLLEPLQRTLATETEHA